ncbi:MAG: T9SS type A sorting domain-containing protein [Saprospiraceae bacterium]
MKQIFIAIAFLIFGVGYGLSQKYDYNFLERTSAIGSAVFIRYNDTINDISINVIPWEGTVFGSPALSNKEGEFLGYFNSRNLYDSIGRVAIDGDSMAVGFFQNYLFQFLPEHEGLGNNQNCAFIPINDSLYYLIYKSAELWAGAPNFAIHFTEKGKNLTSYSDGLYLTKVRLNKDNRLYILPEEKHILLVDELFQMRNLMLCKHANGRDWWLIVPKALDSLASRLLIKANGDIEYLQDIEFSNNYWRVRSVAPYDFSPDGNYLVRFIHRANTIFKDIIELFHFDRCEGTVELLKMDSLLLPSYFSSGADIVFSSNSRFLYVAMGSIILQYDMQDEVKLELRDTIAVWDGMMYYSYHPIFNWLWRLPNGKILVAGFEFTPFLHYIEAPDQKGEACHFIQRAIELPTDPLNEPYGTYIGGLPHFIPFRMDPLETPCGTASTGPTDQIPLNIIPNPAVDIFSITCPALINQVEIYNINGQKIDAVHIQNIQDHYEFSLTGWTPGIYVVICRDKNGDIIGAKKLVKI